ncbi:hypothetical protein [Apibacter sp. HY039]|uniref:hypothetical protein n=1 Tax=Apibacter sp. HY039 TaxID=2501476 RepID=UPI000FEBBF0B|nr:hypothetical protein [Apibacter sp. HY039]
MEENTKLSVKKNNLIKNKFEPKILSRQDNNANEEYISKLKNIAKNYNKKSVFEVGDLVQWKIGLKNRKKPEYNQPAIVIEVLEEPINEHINDKVGVSNLNEKLSLALGFLSENNEFQISYYSQKRFEHYI